MSNKRLLYEIPSLTVLEVRQEGVICASGDTEGFGTSNSYDESIFD